MADETSYLAHTLNTFFESQNVQPHVAASSSFVLEQDWEYVNQLMAALSESKQLAGFLVPYANTNAYITTSGSPKMHNMPSSALDLEHMCAAGGRMLLLHLPVFATKRSTNGHSCLLVLDCERKRQTFYDPWGCLADIMPGSVAARMAEPLIRSEPGWSCDVVAAPRKARTLQSLLEGKCGLDGCCGLACIMAALVMCLQRVELRTAVKQLTRACSWWDAALVRRCALGVNNWYVHGFVNAADGEPVPWLCG